jgi:hypothetical protein
VAITSRRWGKSTLAIYRLIMPSLHGGRTALFQPSHKSGRDLWDDIKRTLAPVRPKVNEQAKAIRLPLTGGGIDVWSLEDVGAGRGRAYHHVVVDEAREAKDLKASWEGGILPTLIDYRGSADIFSSPSGRGYLQQLYLRGRDPNDTDWFSFHALSSENHFLPHGELDALAANMSEENRRREILGEFTDDDFELVFHRVGSAIVRGRTAEVGEEEVRVRLSQRANGGVRDTVIHSLGFDIALSHATTADFSVITILDKNGEQVWWQRFRGMPSDRQEDHIAGLMREFGPLCYAYVDESGLGGAMVQNLQRRSLDVHGFTFTAASKNSLISNLAWMFERGKLRLWDEPVQEAELLAYEYKPGESNLRRTGAPAGQHDDCVMALALAAWGISDNGFYVDTIGAF